MRRALPVLAVVLIPTLVMVVLYWPLPVRVYSWYHPSAFGPSQIWALDYQGDVARGLKLAVDIDEVGYPNLRHAAFLAWLPALIGIPLSAIWGPIGAFNLQILLAPTAAAVFAALWIRRATEADGWTAALAGCLYGLSPYMLAQLAGGNIDKVQLWFYPAWMLAAWVVLHARRGWLLLPVMPLLGLAMAFTEPYFGLFLPLFAGPVLMGRSLWRRSWREAVLSFVSLAATGAGMWPAHGYYSADIRGPTSVFLPSLVERGTAPPPLEEPVATFQNLLIRPFEVPTEVGELVHVSTLGTALLVGVVVVLAWPGRERPAREAVTGLAIAGLGLVIALGPQLMSQGQWQLEPFTAGPFYLPMELLERAGYPLSQGGQYYRANPILGLGLTTALAAGLATRSLRVRALAWLILPLHLAQGFWAGGASYPPQVAAYPGYDILRTVGANAPKRAGVITLPEYGTHSERAGRLMSTVLTGLPTTTTLNHSKWLEGVSHQTVWVDQIRTNTLSRDEYGTIVLFKAHVEAEQPPFLQYDSLTEQYGEPRWEDDDVAVWDLYRRGGQPAPFR